MISLQSKTDDRADAFGDDPFDAADYQCTASSWRSKSQAPYGPGGLNRCVIVHDHTVHEDGWGNRFTFAPTGRIRVRRA